MNSDDGDAVPCLLEPMMKLTLTSDRDVIGSVVQDLLVNRRGQLESDWVGAENDSSGDPQVESGMATNSNQNTFCKLLTMKDQRKK